MLRTELANARIGFDEKYEVCVPEEIWKCAFLSSNNRPFFKVITSS